MGSIVLDAQPLIAVIAAEPSGPQITTRLHTALGSGNSLLISSVNWCEVLYMARWRLGEIKAHRAVGLLRRTPVSIVDANEELGTYAAELKARYRLGLGDAFAAGLALATRSPLLTGDADFLPLAECGLEIDWVGDPAVL